MSQPLPRRPLARWAPGGGADRETPPRRRSRAAPVEPITRRRQNPEVCCNVLVTMPEARRSDAVRNHERVVQAANEVFSELGLAATVPDVAARAGVGKATVYRNFPSRDDLVSAVVDQQLQWFTSLIRSAVDDPDAAAGFRRLVTGWFDRTVTNRLVHDVLRSRDLTIAGPRVGSMIAAVDDLTARAQAAGAVRDDVDGSDLRTLLAGCAQRLVELGQQDEASRSRFSRLILDALRPPCDEHGR